MHATLRFTDGTRVRRSVPNEVSRHQHAVSKLPLRAGAQSFGPPQNGQVCSGAGCALGELLIGA